MEVEKLTMKEHTTNQAKEIQQDKPLQEQTQPHHSTRKNLPKQPCPLNIPDTRYFNQRTTDRSRGSRDWPQAHRGPSPSYYPNHTRNDEREEQHWEPCREHVNQNQTQPGHDETKTETRKARHETEAKIELTQQPELKQKQVMTPQEIAADPNTCRDLERKQKHVYQK
jgi:hypothetical protein